MKKLCFLLVGLICACGPIENLSMVEQPITGLDVRPISNGDYENVVFIGAPAGTQASACTATVLSGHWLMTAAHCVEERTKAINGTFDRGAIINGRLQQWTVGATGLWGQAPQSQFQLYTGPVSLYVLPGFKQASGADYAKRDFALIRLYNDGLMFSPREKYRITSNLYAEPYPRIELLKAVGYGHRPNSNQTDYCQPVSSLAGLGFEAWTKLHWTGSEAFSVKGHGSVSLCEGDSGSPSFIKTSGLNLVFGVASNGSRENGCLCIDPDTEAYYSKVYNKLDWMLEISALSGLPLAYKYRTFGEYNYKYISTDQLFEPKRIFTVESFHTMNPQIRPELLTEDAPQWLLDLYNQLQ